MVAVVTPESVSTIRESFDIRDPFLKDDGNRAGAVLKYRAGPARWASRESHEDVGASRWVSLITFGNSSPGRGVELEPVE
ncbi:hypothetical protein, partial [Clostridium perfringens]